MKKLLLALVIVALCAGSVCAESAYLQDANRRVKTAVAVAAGAISTSVINSNDLILGYSVSVAGTVSQTVGSQVALYDCASSPTASNILDEVEATQTTGTVRVWFPYPLQVTTQLYVGMYGDGGGKTNIATVVIYYEDR